MTYGMGSPQVKVLGRRVVATIVDSLVLGVVSTILSRVFGVHSSSSGFDLTTLSGGGSFVLIVVVVVYYVLMEGFLGRTVGKFLTGIRVVDEATGGNPGFGQVVVRTLLRLIDGLLAYLVGFVIAWNSDRRRRLGDIAAKTLVIRA
jgi:uncharacterized RDD family membrane protein YckC